MSKTTCRVTSSSSFCDVEFYGENADKYNEEWKKIEFENYDSLPFERCDEMDKEAEKLLIEANSDIKKSWWNVIKYGFFENPLLLKRNDIMRERERIYEDAAERSFKSAITLLVEAESYLDENGFQIYSSSDSGDLRRNTAIWKK